MQIREIVREAAEAGGSSKLGDLATIKTNFPDADFWVIRKGDEKTVGKPTTEFNPEHIGIKVTATDVLDPSYLRYVFEYLVQRGYFRDAARGTLRLKNIQVSDVARIPLGVKKKQPLPDYGYRGIKYDISPPKFKTMNPQEYANDPEIAKKLDEATKLPAPSTPLKGAELTQYLDRIRTGTKGKTDKYKMPYIHRKSLVKYYDAQGNRYDEDKIKADLSVRPSSLLKKNEKMEHSDGEFEQFFNIGFAALVGIAVDEDSNELIVVNTCPGAGSCKIECFAMGGGKIQFEGPWLSDGRILTYLLNDPDGFFEQLTNEIERQYKRGLKEGYKVSIRWHDAGDFFSPQYVDMAFKLARSMPNVKFYAYTKMADVALAGKKEKPKNFIINWSEGAHPSQERKVKVKDPSLGKTKNSRIVPTELFKDLLVTEPGPKGKPKLVKGSQGQWQIIPDKVDVLKDRLAREYGLSVKSILTYNEYASKVASKSPLKWNVIIAPGEPDTTANDRGVLSTLLLKH